MDKPLLADRMLAPLTLLERSKGWKRRGLALLYLTIATTAFVLTWRAGSLWNLPDSPEPFDLAKYGRVEVPDADNAMVAYREAISKVIEPDTRGYGVTDIRAWEVSDWSVADPGVRRWAEDYRGTLEEWIPANDRGDSLEVQPEDLRMGTALEISQKVRPFVRLALLEGSRLEQTGDLSGAWRMYRATLRASRHVGRHGGTIQRLIGYSFLNQARPRVDAWIAHPKMTPELLRRATGDVEACRAMTSPASEMVRAEYFSSRAAVNGMDFAELDEKGPYSPLQWYNQFAVGRWGCRFLRREPERSARVLRLITAGNLAQCDRPKASRPQLRFPDLMIYDHDEWTPREVRAISPDALEAWARDSIVMDLVPSFSLLQAYLDAEKLTFDHFALKMAERAFAIERGRPPKRYGELLGPFLKALPYGIEPEDVVIP